MAGHSHAKNIMHRKGAQDIRRGKVFNKLAREIAVAAKSGMPDPAANPRLRSAIQAARQANMTRDRIERAIKSGSPGGDDANYEEMRYEGYGPGGVAIIVEALTDNRNRTAAEIRSAFAKAGGAMGETNSVSFMFSKVGLLSFPASVATAEAMFEAALDAGAQNVESDEETHEITTVVEDFASVRDALEQKFGTPQAARLTWQPLTTSAPDEDTAASLLKLLDALDDNDDVQYVVGNFEIADALLEKLAG